ncbi:MAG: hypothetical protein ACI82I_000597 [Gammaproteobacteria bacterium]|jgi:hypothetical protein
MPITLTLTEGALPKGAEAQAIARITDAFLAAHQMSGNTVMTPNITAHVSILPTGTTFAGGKPVVGAWVETKTPNFALADHAVQADFFNQAADVLQDLSGGTLARERIWANGVHAVDGTWNISGVTMTNAQIGEAVSHG